jgi:hypothetical protein
MEVVAISSLVQFVQVSEQRPGIARPKNDYIHVGGQQGNPGDLSPVEGIGNRAETLSDAIHEPGGVEGRNIRSSARADDHPGILVAGLKGCQTARRFLLSLSYKCHSELLACPTAYIAE